jgi:hypothetical protein
MTVTALLLMMHADDKTISVEDGRKFAAVLPCHRMVEVEGADHNFTGKRFVPRSPTKDDGVDNVVSSLCSAMLPLARTDQVQLYQCGTSSSELCCCCCCCKVEVACNSCVGHVVPQHGMCG